MDNKSDVSYLAFVEACRVLEFVMRVKYGGKKTQGQIMEAILKRIPTANEIFKEII